MAAMQCDLCGERLTMDVSGQYAVCDFCGIKHPKERLMKKVSEISTGIDDSDNAQTDSIQKAETALTSQKVPDVGFQEENISESKAVNYANPEPVSNPEPVFSQPVSEPEPIFSQPVSNPESVLSQPVSEPEPVNNQDISESPVMGNIDIGMDIGDGPVFTAKEQTESEAQVDLDGMTTAERAEYEKKANRIKELNDELKEFEEIYEANKNKFLGEGLKRKNYSEIKIKEIKEKLEELGA